MATTAGEFFVNIGINGADKTTQSLSNVKTGLGDVKSGALAAKAAILAAVYALYQFTGNAAKHGTELVNFNYLTGIPTKFAEKWDLAAQKVGDSAGDIKASMEAVQNAMAAIDWNQGAPAGLAEIAKRLGGVNFERFKKDAVYRFQQIRKFVNDPTLSAQDRNYLVETLGVSRGTISAFKNPKFRPDQISDSEVLLLPEAKALSEVHGIWVSFWNDFARLAEKATAKLAPAMNLALKSERAVTGFGISGILGFLTGVGPKPFVETRNDILSGKAFSDAGEKVINVYNYITAPIETAADPKEIQQHLENHSQRMINNAALQKPRKRVN